MVIGFMLLGIACFLSILFYYAYHTFHPRLPELFKQIVLIIALFGLISIFIDLLI